VIRRKTGQAFALKLVQLPEDEDDRDRVMAEAKAEIELLRDISHANVTRFYNAWKQDNQSPPFGQQLAILMEYADGGSLQALIKEQKPRGGFAEDKVRTWFAQLVAAFEHLHSGAAVHAKPDTTVLHRDIKPENILVTQDDRIKVCDVGVAKIVEGSDDAKQMKTIVGNALYKAPEAFDRDYGTPSDVWSVGAVLYQLMNAKLQAPFIGNDLFDQMRVVKEQPCPQPPGGYGRLAELAVSMLRKKPEERPTFEELRWEEVVDETLVRLGEERRAAAVEKAAAGANEMRLSTSGDPAL